MKGTAVPQGASVERDSLSQTYSKAVLPTPKSIFHLVLLMISYDYNMHVEGLMSANLYLVSLLSSDQCSQFGKYRVQMVNKHPVSKQN